MNQNRHETNLIVVHHWACPCGPKSGGLTERLKHFHGGVFGRFEEAYSWEGAPLRRVLHHCAGGPACSWSLAFCFVGDLRVMVPDETAMKIAVNILADWCQNFGVRPEQIRAHHEVELTVDCPGALDMPALRRAVTEEIRRRS